MIYQNHSLEEHGVVEKKKSELGKMVKNMEKALITIHSVILILGIGLMTKGMGRVLIFTLLVKNMLGIGKMIRNMA